MIRFLLTIGSLTGLNRLLGIGREVLLSYFLGTSIITEAFVVATKIPSLFRRVFTEGAFNSAFVPLFSKEYSPSDTKSANEFASQVLSLWFYGLLVLLVIFELFTPQFMRLIAPGLKNDPERLGLVVIYGRIIFPFILFIALAAVLSAVLNSLERFFTAAAAPGLLNVLTIIALLIHKPLGLDVGLSLSWFVFVSGFMQFGWLYYSCQKAGLTLKFVLPKISPSVRKLFWLMGPGIIAASITQINVVVDICFASFLPRGSIAFLNYADKLNQMPLSIVGVAVGTSLLPMLSKTIHDPMQTTQKQNDALRLVSLWILPCAVALIALKEPIVKLVFGHGKFTPQDVLETSKTLAAFAVGLPAYILSKIFLATFFAHQDTHTPLYVAVGSIAVNILLNFLLIDHYAHMGMAISTSIAGWVNTCTLFVILCFRKWIHIWQKTWTDIGLAGLSCALMVISLPVVYDWLTSFMFTGLIRESLAITSLIIYSLLVYALMIQFFKFIKTKIISST